MSFQSNLNTYDSTKAGGGAVIILGMILLTLFAVVLLPIALIYHKELYAYAKGKLSAYWKANDFVAITLDFIQLCFTLAIFGWAYYAIMWGATYEIIMILYNNWF
jgi:hypothetical protein